MVESFAEIARKYWNNVEALETMVSFYSPGALKNAGAIFDVFSNLSDILGISDEGQTRLNRVFQTIQEAGATVESELSDISLTAVDGRDLDSFVQSFATQPVLLEGVRTMAVMAQGVKIINRSALIMLTSFFEVLLSDLIHMFFHLRSDALNADEKGITYSQLREFKTVEDIRDYIVTSKAEELLRGDVESWNEKFFKKHLNIELPKQVPGDWGEWYEIFQRRNVLIHNDGRVNRIYLNKVRGSLSGEATELPALGEELEVSDEYLRRSIDLFLVVGMRLVDVVWAKLAKDGNRERDGLLSVVITHALRKEKWLVVDRLSEFAIARGCSSEADRLRYQVNHWLAVKRSGGWDQTKNEVFNFDTSACSPYFAICIHALREDKEAFLRAMPAAIKSGFTMEEASIWPVLDDLRADSEVWSKVTALFETN